MGAAPFGRAKKNLYDLPPHNVKKSIMNIKVKSWREGARVKNLILPIFEKEPLPKGGFFVFLPKTLQKTAERFAKESTTGKIGETKWFWSPERGGLNICFLGLGERSRWNTRQNHTLLRRAVTAAKDERAGEITVALSPLLGETPEAQAHTAVIGALMASFEFDHYKEKKTPHPLRTLILACDPKVQKDAEQGAREGIVIGRAVNEARVLTNTPGSDLTPRRLAEAAYEALKDTGASVRVLETEDMELLGMGGIIGVSKGAAERPKFIIIEYNEGAVGEKPLVLVGKGVTFDTGGLDIKTDNHMYEMHMDMSGGAAVIYGMAAIARLKLPIHVVGLIPAVENMISGASYKPGDILKTITGKTIEVLDTDAEGRIILADALGYAARFKPGLIVDFATLTGAAMAALGRQASAILTNAELLIPYFSSIGTASGDFVWPLPLWDEYFENIKGNFGDITNVGKKESRLGDAINGAKLLEQFVGKTPWLHVDIAPRMTPTDNEFLARGATGVGVRYIVELAKRYHNIHNDSRSSRTN